MDGALQLAGDRASQKRFFAWVHLYDPHAPYEPPEPFASRYAGQPYLGEIAYTDAVVGRLTAWLREQGQLERTLLVVTADHGESLGDHGEASARLLHLWRDDARAARSCATPWGLAGTQRGRRSPAVDLMPTVLDLVGLPPQEGIDGRSLARALLDPRRPRATSRIPRPTSPAITSAGSICAACATTATPSSTRPSPSCTTARGSGRDAQHLQGQQPARGGPARPPGATGRSRPARGAPSGKQPRPRHAAAPGRARLRGQRHRRRPQRGAARSEGTSCRCSKR